MAKLHFIKPGLQTTIQDQGRFGHQHLGIPLNGAMDKASARFANELVGNPTYHPVLEITLLGPQIRFEGECHIAIAGANLSPTLSGKPISLYQTIYVEEGNILNFGRPVEGCRAYLAIAGEWKIPKWLGSFSASAIESFTPESHIRKNSVLEIETSSIHEIREIPVEERPSFANNTPIKVLPGPEFESFSKIFIAQFFGKEHIISPDSNRMGYRLKESIKGYQPEKEMISSGIIPGTVQITNEGQPIILLADAQTTGGYPRIVNVVTEDIDRLAQFKPGDAVRFELAG